MNFRLFGCGKFRFLAIEKFDRELTPREGHFYRKHRDVCIDCLRYEQQGMNAMNLLTAAAMDAEISDGFDEKLIRTWRNSQKRTALGYWSPILAGAAVACLALIATLQLISRAPLLWNNSPARAQGAFRYNEDQDATARNLVLPQNWTQSKS